MDFTQFVQWAFYGIAGGGMVIGLKILDEMRKSIEKLNIKMAEIVQKTVSHEERIEKFDERLTFLERHRSE